MSAAGEAAAALVPEMAQELVEKIPDIGNEEDRLREDLAALDPAAVAAPAQAPAQAAAPVVEEEPFEFPSFEPVNVDDDEDDEVIPVEESQDEEEPEPSGYVDPDDLARDNQRLRKQLDVQNRQRAAEMQKVWAARYKERYPLADFDLIQTPSRRAYEKEAAKSHNRNYEKLKPFIDKLQKASVRVKSEATTAAQSQVQEAWGRPTVGPSLVPVEAAGAQAELEAARRTGNLTKVIGALRRINEQQGG